MGYLYTAALLAIAALVALTGYFSSKPDIALFWLCTFGAGLGVCLHFFFRHRRIEH